MTEAGRRGALKTLVAGGSVVFVGGVAAPAVCLALAPAAARKQADALWVRVARLADLLDNEPKRVPVVSEVVDAWTRYSKENLGAVWLIRTHDEVHALSVTCPHLGCGVEKSDAGFGCPCHTSAFDPTGKLVSGPSPRDMDPIETRVVGVGEERTVEVKFKKFRQGLPEREEIG